MKENKLTDDEPIKKKQKKKNQENGFKRPFAACISFENDHQKELNEKHYQGLTSRSDVMKKILKLEMWNMQS